jgi:hypothetical protein
LLDRRSITGASPPALLALVIFEMESNFFAHTGLNCNLPTYAFLEAQMAGVCHHAYLFYWLRWAVKNFFPRLVSNHDSPSICLLSSLFFKINFYRTVKIAPSM